MPQEANATPSLSTLVLKVQETISLSSFFDYKAPFWLPENYLKYAQRAQYYLPSQPTSLFPAMADFWTALDDFGVTLKPLYLDTPPHILLDLLDRARQRTSGYNFTHLIVSPLRSANPFTYFQIQASTDLLHNLEKVLKTYLPDQSTKPSLLELVYRRGAFVEAAPPRTPARGTRYDTLLAIPPAHATPPKNPVRLHIVDMGWQTHPYFRGRINLVSDILFSHPVGSTPTRKNQAHGCGVLGLLAADKLACPPIAPHADVGLFSSYKETGGSRIDDALAHALYAARPADVVLIELALWYDYDDFSGFFPVEADQACYDLIWLATHELGIQIIEPAGNSQQDMAGLDQAIFNADNDRIDEMAGVHYEQDYPIDGSLEATNIRKRPRYLIYQETTTKTLGDSGAIMVGAAKLTNSKWRNSTNYGTRIDCLAPGDALLTTGLDHTTVSFGGTSGASALLAGFVTRLTEDYHRRNRPTTPQAIRQLLRMQSQVGTSPVGMDTRARWPSLSSLLA